MTFLIAYGGALAVFLVMDILWIAVVARNFYLGEIGALMRDNIIIWPAILFYLAYIVAIVYLVIFSNIDQSWSKVAITGAVLGMAAYGAYDMTNFSIIQGYSGKVAFVDWAWGMVVTASSSLGGYMAVKYFTS